MYDKVYYSITAREIILEWDKTACRFVFFLLDLDLDLDLAVAGLVTSLHICVRRESLTTQEL